MLDVRLSGPEHVREPTINCVPLITKMQQPDIMPPNQLLL